MADPINMEDAELLDLMAALELETGVAAATATAPVVAASTAPVITPEPAKAAVATSEVSEDEVLLNALAEEPVATTPATAPEAEKASGLPAALLAGIKAQQASAVAKDPVVADAAEAEAADLADANNINDELALLEAGLADEPAQTTAAVTVSVAAQPGVTAAVVAETVSRAVADAATASVTADASSDLAAHYSTLDFFVDPKKFNVDTRLSDVELDKNMMEQNSLRAYYGSQAAQAEAQSARTKMKFEIIEAKLYDQHRRLLLENGEKVTEKMVENEVKKDSRWAIAKGKVIDADTISSINRALVESLRDRQSMLVQLSADRRDEFKQSRSTMAQTNAQEEQRQRANQAAKEAIG